MGSAYLLRISLFATVSSESTVFIIGGWSEHGHMSVIASFKDDNWSEAGHLQIKRYSHTAIKYNNKIMIIGGRRWSNNL